MTIDETEEKIMDSILSVLNSGRKICESIMREDRLTFHGLVVDGTHRVVLKDDLEIKLTFTEFEILQLLARNPGRIFSKEQIYDIVWNEPYFGDYNIIMSHIRHIREKVEDDPGHPIYIQTVWGVGYRFNNKIM